MAEQGQTSKASGAEAKERKAAEESGSKEWKAAAEELEKAIGIFEERVAGEGDLCETYMLIALNDGEVRKHFIEHAMNHEAFQRVFCFQTAGVHEQKLVFEFICVPPKICLFPMRFMVRINVVTGEVDEIVDPAPGVIPVGPAMPGAFYRM